MKAITLWQPWASLVAISAKRIETRSWQTSYRGPLAIHAAKSVPPIARQLWEEEAAFREAFANEGITDINQLPKGCILAYTRIIKVQLVRVGDVLPSEPERIFGDYSPLRHMWHLGDVERLSEPIPCRGGQLLWNVTPELDADPSGQMDLFSGGDL